MKQVDEQFLSKVAHVLAEARNHVKTTINLSMVYTYFDIGRMIVEEEQNGEDRAEYGKYVVEELSKYLTDRFGKGFSATNLKQMRRFYIVYADDAIGQTASDQLKNMPTIF